MEDGLTSLTPILSNTVNIHITPFRAIMNDMYAKDISKNIKAVKLQAHPQQHLSAVHHGRGVYLPFHQGADGIEARLL